MIHIGIDPGLSGALAVIYATGEAEVRDMPVMAINARLVLNAAATADLLREWTCGQPTDVIIEGQQPMPGQGRSSIFSLGRTMGALEGILGTIGLRYSIVQPRAWKRAYGLDSNKQASIGRACQLFPLLASDLARKKDHGRAEALLLAELSRRAPMPVITRSAA